VAEAEVWRQARVYIRWRAIYNDILLAQSLHVIISF
jgi:hypothetical protein